MDLEKELLLVKRDSVFSLSMNDAVILERLLKEIGAITSLYFTLCGEYANTLAGAEDYEDKLQAYSDRLMGDSIEFDTSETKEFLSKLQT